MVAGAGLYDEAYLLMQDTILGWGDLGEVTLLEMPGVNHWAVIAAIWPVAVLLFRWFEKMKLYLTTYSGASCLQRIPHRRGKALCSN
ncbi:MAG: hypothetical protein OHK006_23190 [Thermodesulfovibrionales bacterium]